MPMWPCIPQDVSDLAVKRKARSVALYTVHSFKRFPKMHLIHEPLTSVCAWCGSHWSLNGRTILLKCGMSKGPTSDKAHLRSFMFSSRELSNSTLLCAAHTYSSWYITEIQRVSRKGNLNKITCHVTWKFPMDNNSPLNLICDVAIFYKSYMIHEREKLSVARYKLDNQALIWDLIKGSQHEEAALTKSGEYVNSENNSSSF